MSSAKEAGNRSSPAVVRIPSHGKGLGAGERCSDLRNKRERKNNMKLVAATCSVILSATLLSYPSATRPSGFAISEVITITKELGKKLEWPADKITDLVVNLEKAVQEDLYKKEVEQKAVTAVFVYKATEAGLILKIMRGSGLITFKDGKKAAEISLKSSSLGAQIGGSAEWGVGLVMGLTEMSHFGGEYSGSVRKATAVDSSTSSGVVLTPSSNAGKDTHQLFMVTTGRGLSAGVGGAKLTITPSW
jgi:hypothetical protein